ncbi:MAG: hypothetical protein EOM11_06280 [Erysipelotrichia bacterium]|nr:hypothetical protein [Erysipelotrichia bacterium]
MQTITIFLYFIIYAFLGWICESVYKSVFRKKMINSGFLNGPICPIYGFGALLIIYLLTPFQNNPFFVFIFGVLTTSLLEYFTSWLLESLFHMSWWDYSKRKFNIHGRVCLLNATMFGLMSLFVMYIAHPITTHLFKKIDVNTQLLLAGVIFTLLLIDTIVSIISVLNMNKSLVKIHDYLHSIFANMDGLTSKISKENELIIQRLIKKRAHLKRAFPNLEHKRFDIRVKNLNEIIIKTKNNLKK